jgi:hypothetical protein
MGALILFLTVVDLGLGLALESYGAQRGWYWAEPLVGATTSLLYVWLLAFPPRIGKVQITRATLLVCLMLAILGELVMSAGFQFYLYRQSILPAFVPPGHVLLFLSGVAITQMRWFRLGLVLPFVGLVLCAFAWQISHGRDWLSVGFLLVFLPCMVWGPHRNLYAVMFVLALGLEFYGTWLGTWAWQPFIVGLGAPLHSANPPLAAGAGYTALDLATFQVTFWLLGANGSGRSAQSARR